MEQDAGVDVKRFGQIWLPVLVAVGDVAAIIVGAWLAYQFRFSVLFTSYIPIVTGLPPVDWYLRLSMVSALLTFMMLLTGQLYRFPRQDGMFDELVTVFRMYTLGYTLLLAALFFYREVTFSRITVGFLFLFSGCSLVIVRIIGRKLRQFGYRRGLGVRRAAIVGHGSQLGSMISHLNDRPQFGFSLIGNISDEDDEEPSTDKLKWLGEVSMSGKIVQQEQLDTLIIAPSERDSRVLPRVVESCYGVNVDFLYLPDIQPVNGRPRKVIEVGGAPLWTLKENPFSGWQGIVKRLFDVSLAGIMLLFLLPLLVIIAILIKLESRGALIYRQRRVGLDGREFDCIKFRSMRLDAESGKKPGWTTQNDERVTRFGRIIRRWSIDELPQLWNILIGDMSLIGPRPERPEYVKEFAERIDGYHERHRVRSGLTGWAQVNGLRGDTPIEERTHYDRYYIENWSLMFDLKILVLTLWAVIKGDNAY